MSACGVRRRPRARRGGADRRVHRRARRPGRRRQATRTRSCSCSTAAPTPPRRAPARRRERSTLHVSTPTHPASATRAARAWTSPLSASPPDGLIATTDADSEPAPDWLRAQLDAVARGAPAIGGRVEVGVARPAARGARAGARPTRTPPRRARRARRARAPPVQRRVDRRDRRDVRAGRRFEPRDALEDEGFERALHRHGVPIDRLAAVRVTTSGRRLGRAPPRARRRPAAQQLARRAQLRRAPTSRSNGCSRPRTARSASSCPRARSRRRSPACSTRSTPLAPAGRRAARRRRRLARRHGRRRPRARRRRRPESALQPQHGPALGKGDAMWRGLAATTGELVALPRHRHRGLHAALRARPARPAAHRPDVDVRQGPLPPPAAVGDTTHPDGGGRVTELLARPYLNLHFPAAGRVPPAAGGRDRGRARTARTAPVPRRLRRRDRDADRRARTRSASSGWPRSTSARARTATSRSRDSQRMALEVLAAAERRDPRRRATRPRPAAHPDRRGLRGPRARSPTSAHRSAR